MKKSVLFYAALFYIVISTVVVISAVLNFYDLQFRGYWTEKVIAWIWIISTIFIIRLFWQHKGIKIYFSSLITLVILSILPMGIPFFGMINYISTAHDYQRIKLNDDYRIELTQHQPLSVPRIYIYQKQNFWLEKNVARPHYEYDIFYKIMGTDKILDISQPILLTHAQFIKADNHGIYIHYDLADKQKVIYHEFCDTNEIDCGY